MKTDRAVARRYADALLQEALAQKADAVALRADLQKAAATFSGNTNLRQALLHPGIPNAKKQAVLDGVFTEKETSVFARRMLKLLVDRGRVALLPDVADLFGELWNAHRGVLPAHAVSAAALDAKQETALHTALAAATGRDVELRTTVDPALLGGLKVTVGGQTYDGTVRTRLATLRRRLSGAATA